jgi:hypothetical protein
MSSWWPSGTAEERGDWTEQHLWRASIYMGLAVAPVTFLAVLLISGTDDIPFAIGLTVASVLCGRLAGWLYIRTG